MIAARHLTAFFAVAVLLFTPSLGNTAHAQITGATSSRLVIDTTKLSTSAGTVDSRINACLALGSNVVCDASSEPLKAPVQTTITFPTNSSGITLIVNTLLGVSNSSVDVEMLSVAGNNNEVYCVQNWGSYPVASAPPSFDGSAFVQNSSPPPVIQITGNGNKFHDCYVQGPYLHMAKPFNKPYSPHADCISVVGNGNNLTAPTGNDIEIKRNFMQYCGNRGIYTQDTYRAKILDNYTLQTFGAGVAADAPSVSSANGEIAGNIVQDAELQYNDAATNANAGNGDINIISSLPTVGFGSLHGWIIHDNFVVNTSTVCNSSQATSTGSPTDHGCSEGIQVTEKPWDIHIYNNYVYNTGSEGITLCEYNCSATNNFVGDSGQNCPPDGCGGILEAIQLSTTAGLTIGNTVVSGNTIWNDSTGGSAMNTAGVMGYCMWQHVASVATTGPLNITNDNWTGNTCGGTVAAAGASPGKIVDGFKINNSSSASVTISGINVTDNTIDAVNGAFGTVTTPINENYVAGGGIVGRVFYANNNVYNQNVTPLSLPTVGDLAFYDSFHNLMDSGISVVTVTNPVNFLSITPGTTGSPTVILQPTGTGPNVNLSLLSMGTGTVQLNGGFAVNSAGLVSVYGGQTTAGLGVTADLGAQNITGQAGDLTATTLLAVPTAATYRVSIYIAVTTTGTTSTMPDVCVLWTDRDNSTSVQFLGSTHSNLNTTSTVGQASFFIDAKSATNIQIATGTNCAGGTGYASSPGLAMKYKMRAKAEAM